MSGYSKDAFRKSSFFMEFGQSLSCFSHNIALKLKAHFEFSLLIVFSLCI